ADHTIIVQITCKNADDYEYKIYNTGIGHKFHKVNPKTNEAYPITYKNLGMGYFSYSFFSDLLNLAFETNNIDQFYQLHEENFSTENQRLDEGNPYRLQNYNICTSSAVEAFLINFLSSKDYKQIEQIKIKSTLNKQQAVVNKLKGEVEEASWCTVKRDFIYRDKTLQTKTEEYEENRYLLNLGKRMALLIT